MKIATNIATSTAAMIRHLRADARLWWGAMVTSWFWLVGIVVLSLLPPLIKTLIGGNEDTVTAYLAMFSVAVGAGSGLGGGNRAWPHRAQNDAGRRRAARQSSRSISALRRLAQRRLPSPQGPAAVFTSALGIRAAVDLCGLAVAGGLFIVPAFAAVQAWSGADYRARTIAAVNVLNAAFMTGATIIVAVMQKYRSNRPGAVFC